jgi:hypothetical protein
MKKIMESWRSHYKRLAAQNILAESIVEKEEFPPQEGGNGSSEAYSVLSAEQDMMADVFAIGEGDDNGSALEMIRSDEWEEPNAKRFLESLNAGKRGEFLAPYSEKDLSAMKLFKLKEHNLGFAVKSDGDIVSVHNNSGLGGLGKEMMAAAVRNGGKKLDHFDGFLTGFYKKNGFGKVTDAWAWNDKYAPENWKYEPVNIFDPRTSIYADELRKYNSVEEMPDDLKAKIRAYESGRPDVVFRQLG